MFPELRFGWHANDGALKSLQGVFQQYRPTAVVASLGNSGARCQHFWAEGNLGSLNLMLAP